MEILNLQNSNRNVSFSAKITPEFENAIRGFYNNGANRLKNQYRLVQKIEQLDKFGHNDYTVGLTKKYQAYGTEYTLYAVKDGQTADEGVVLAKRNSFKNIVNAFMNMKKHDFISKIKYYHQ